MGLEWKLLGAVGYGLPLASGVIFGMISVGIEGNTKLGLFLWLVSLLFVGLAWILLGLEARQKSYVFVGIVALLAFFSTAYFLKSASGLISNASMLKPPSAFVLWILTLSASFAFMYVLLEIVAMVHAGGTFGERFLRWSAWTKALAFSLLALALLSFLPMIGGLLEAFFYSGNVNLASFLTPFIALGAAGIAYIISTVFAMIGFLDLKVNKETRSGGDDRT